MGNVSIEAPAPKSRSGSLPAILVEHTAVARLLVARFLLVIALMLRDFVESEATESPGRPLLRPLLAGRILVLGFDLDADRWRRGFGFRLICRVSALLDERALDGGVVGHLRNERRAGSVQLGDAGGRFRWVQGKPQRRQSFVLVQIRVGQLWMNAEQFLTQLGVQGLHASALHSGRSTFTRRRRRYQSNVRPSRRHWRTLDPAVQ